MMTTKLLIHARKLERAARALPGNGLSGFAHKRALAVLRGVRAFRGVHLTAAERRTIGCPLPCCGGIFDPRKAYAGHEFSCEG